MLRKYRFIRGLKQAGWCLAILLSFVVSPVHADDTEVYFQATSGNTNLLFLLDTSASMNSCRNVELAGGLIQLDLLCGKNDASRFEQLQKVFSQLIDSLPGTFNVGLGAFSGSRVGTVGGGVVDQGGYVLYPVRNLDEPASPFFVSSVLKDDNDIILETYKKTSCTGLFGCIGDVIGGIFDALGDVSEFILGKLTVQFPSNNKSNTATGMIFRDLNVPRGATVKSAKLVVRSTIALGNDKRLDMVGAYAIGAGLPGFSKSQNLKDRNFGSQVESIVVNNAWGTASDETIDVTALVQHAISDSEWCGGDDVLLRFQNANTSDKSYRKIGRGSASDPDAGDELNEDDAGLWNLANLYIEWEPSSSGSQSGSTCVSDQRYGLGAASNDVTQEKDGTMDSDSGSLTMVANESNSKVAVRFSNLRFNSSDTINEAILHLPFSGSEMEGGRCQYGDDLGLLGIIWYDLKYGNSDYGKNDVASFVCGRDKYKVGAGLILRKTQWKSGGDSKVLFGKVRLKIQAVTGDAGAIGSSNNALNNYAVAATKTVELTAGDFNSSGVLDIDVTDLARQAVSSQRNAAMMFIISAEYDHWPVDSKGKQVVVPTSFSLSSQDSNAGGASISFEVESSDTSIGTPLVRDQLKSVVNDLKPHPLSATPLANAYMEMARYLTGQAPFFGDGKNIISDKDSGLLRRATSTQRAMSGDHYQSPLETNGLKTCEPTSTILLTDGEATDLGKLLDKNKPDSQLQKITGLNSCKTSFFANKQQEYDCMAAMADWLKDDNANSLNRSITTNLIGFYLNEGSNTVKQMRSVSDAGGGVTLTANDADSLLEAFRAIVNSVRQTSGIGSSAGIAVNQANRLEHLDQLYYSVFQPRNVSTWKGNLKRYRLGGEAGSPQIVDANDNAAIADGLFSPDSQSFWSDLVDGGDVTKGGAFGVLRATMDDDGNYRRKLFVSSDVASIGTTLGELVVNRRSLSRVNNNLPAERFGLSAEDNGEVYIELLNHWLLTAWGDALHSDPQLVGYDVSGSGAERTTRNVVFISDNAGMLHAIDAADGKELFAFMPAEELRKVPEREGIDRRGSPLLDTTTHKRTTYGLDSPWTFWVERNANGKATQVFTYAGQRRGGQNYYALDVTQVGLEGEPAPKMLWQITPDSAEPFALLGQTWSQPQLAKVRLAGKDVPVLIFAGGYDTRQDGESIDNSVGDEVGHAIYMVNAYTGALIWYASNEINKLGSGEYSYTQNSDMKWSIPATPAVVDLNGDGYVDAVYVGDMHGQLFRVDITKGAASVDTLVAGVHTLAKLGGSEENNRRFYAMPDVALGERNGRKVVQIALGSGYRSHPLSNAVNDRFYGLDDTTILPMMRGVAAEPPVISTDTLVDVTHYSADKVVCIGHGEFECPEGSVGSEAAYGWQLSLDASIGEKVLEPAAIANGTVFFTAFTTALSQLDLCNVAYDGSRLYAVRLKDGAADGMFDNALGGSHGRAVALKVPGIPPKPQVLLTDQLNLLVGTEPVNIDEKPHLIPVRWYESSESESRTLLNQPNASEKK